MSIAPIHRSKQDLHEILERIAWIYETSTDESDYWDGNEIIEQIDALLEQEGYVTHCDEHGSYPSTETECPRCVTARDQDDNEGDNDDGP